MLYGDIFVLYGDIFVLYMLLEHSMLFSVHFLRFSELIEPKWGKSEKTRHGCADGVTVGTTGPAARQIPV
jgi:hypothetical protein